MKVLIIISRDRAGECKDRAKKRVQEWSGQDRHLLVSCQVSSVMKLLGGEATTEGSRTCCKEPLSVETPQA